MEKKYLPNQSKMELAELETQLSKQTNKDP